jgi:membrane protein implicated in regulation of membrane protease activity
MQTWWAELSGISRFFYGMAAFCSVFFLWQIIGSFLGLSGDEMPGDTPDADLSAEVAHDSVAEASQAFKLFSLRSLVTFFTLFSWGSALYTTGGRPSLLSMALASLWGLVGMAAVASVFYFMGKLTETGTRDIATCVGQSGEVYLDIPANGQGEIRILVNGTLDHVKARCASGASLKAGTPVRVVRVLNPNLVEVEL